MNTLMPITMEEIKCTQLNHELQSGKKTLKIVNALNAAKFDLLRIETSINFSDLAALQSTLDKEDEIVVYCTEYCCYKSVSLYHQLKSAGFKHVRRLAGGLKKWSEMGLPLEGKLAVRND